MGKITQALTHSTLEYVSQVAFEQVTPVDMNESPTLETPFFRANSNNPEPINWVSALPQLEVAGLALRAGWDILFEPALGKGRSSADIRLTNDLTQLFMETTSMRMSIQERKALAFFDHLFWQLYSLGSRYGVRIFGSVRGASPENAEDLAQWLQDIEEAARATARDGRSRQVPGPEEVFVTVFRPTEAMAGEPWGVEGDPIEARILDRLLALLRDKNRQFEGSTTPVWVRLNESAGLWQSTRFQGMTLARTLTFLTDFLQEAFVSLFPNLAGVLLSSGVLWVDDAPPDSLVERVEHNGGIALRSPIPVHHARETIIVPRAGVPGIDAKVFADWYANEDRWLDWALKELEYPPFNALVCEPLGESGL